MYAPRDQVKASDMNLLLQGSAEVPGGFRDDLKATLPFDLELNDDVIIVPDIAMPAYSVMYGKECLGVENNKVKIAVTCNSTNVTPGADSILVTNGSLALASGQAGYGQILRPGRPYLVRGNCPATVCGLLLDGTIPLSTDRLGFLGHAVVSIEAIDYSIVTIDSREYRGQTVGAIATNTFGDVRLYHLSTLTTKVIRAFNTGVNIPALKNVVLKINNYRANAYEEC
jgi:hypothetical protein